MVFLFHTNPLEAGQSYSDRSHNPESQPHGDPGRCSPTQPPGSPWPDPSPRPLKTPTACCGTRVASCRVES